MGAHLLLSIDGALQKLLAGVAIVGSFAVLSGAITAPTQAVESIQADADQQDPFVTDESGISKSDRAGVLGRDVLYDDDSVHVVMSDKEGLSVISASGADGYEWNPTASIPVFEADTDLWVSNSCITSSGRYMTVVYGPRNVSNDEAQFGHGASAAIVDLDTSSVRQLGPGFSIAYFNPGCGENDTVALTSLDLDTNSTLLASIDAANGKVLNKVKLDGAYTSAISRSDGSFIAAGPKGLEAIDGSGSTSTIAVPEGGAYNLVLDAPERLAYVVTNGTKETSSAYVVPLTGKDRQRPQLIATGPTTELGLNAKPGGGIFLRGSELKTQLGGFEGISEIPVGRALDQISSSGGLVIKSVKPAGLARSDSSGNLEELDPQITAEATSTRQSIVFTLDPNEFVPESNGMRASEPDPDFERLNESKPAGVSQTQPLPGAGFVLSLAGDPHDPVEAERFCSVPRNDPQNQAYQPKPRQVEWAVDRAVAGELTELRPANWRNLGMPSYSPQALFPPVALSGGGSIPPQVVLGVLMQESNLWQASRYTSPGNTGNPLVGNYYGNRGEPTIWDIVYTDADCGFGVGQITDGMRLAGHEKPGETALPYNQQRAIALDYQANIAMVIRMLGQKWNELAAAGMQINDGDPANIENWFFATWTYNSGFYPYVNSSTPWGVGWFNNPVNDIYPPSRLPFLEDSQTDAANPQQWPYPEKVMGWAAWGTSLVETAWTDSSSRTYETSLKSSYLTAWWNDIAYRTHVKPPRVLFCDLSENDCDPTASQPCQLASDKCWWNNDAEWKDCDYECGYGYQRFDSSYATEASSMSSSLPALTLQSSYPANCDSPPLGVVVVDDTKHPNARNSGECTHRSTAGSFEFTFGAADSNGNYPAKVDLHQQGGGFNGHFSFAHMQNGAGQPGYNAEAKITGKWNRGANMNGVWTRVWVHLPDYAAWTQQAAYRINFGDGTYQTRYVQQRQYDNSWISLGVFQMKGTPSIELSNSLTSLPDSAKYGGYSPAGRDDVAWDAVGFEALAAKPANFVVALGDSFSSGEGAGDYAPWSDNNGENISGRNGCHQSENAWIRKTTLPGDTATIGTLADTANDSMDFQFLACSGAETENLLPYHTATGAAPHNSETYPGPQYGDVGQWQMVSQLDAGYLDANTTLVTLSIGGNDMRFVGMIGSCVKTVWDCSGNVLEGDSLGIVLASADRLANELPQSLSTVLAEIRSRAPNAQIALMGYPSLFEDNSSCAFIATVNTPWLEDLTNDLAGAMQDAATAANAPGEPEVYFVDPRAKFVGHSRCVQGGQSAITDISLFVTPGEEAYVHFGNIGFLTPPSNNYASQTSLHPNSLGTDLYSEALEAELALH